MKKIFARAIEIEGNRSINVFTLPVGGTRIEGIIKQPDGTWSQHGICFSDEAMEVLIKILGEWKKEVLNNK